jgi:hypothetical protein
VRAQVDRDLTTVSWFDRLLGLIKTWGVTIFWKVFRRSCGPLTRSVGLTDRSAGLLVGRTLVGDGREPGRWGPRGTHVSQARTNENDCQNKFMSSRTTNMVSEQIKARVRARYYYRHNKILL